MYFSPTKLSLKKTSVQNTCNQSLGQTITWILVEKQTNVCFIMLNPGTHLSLRLSHRCHQQHQQDQQQCTATMWREATGNWGSCTKVCQTLLRPGLSDSWSSINGTQDSPASTTVSLLVSLLVSRRLVGHQFIPMIWNHLCSNSFCFHFGCGCMWPC